MKFRGQLLEVADRFGDVLLIENDSTGNALIFRIHGGKNVLIEDKTALELAFLIINTVMRKQH